MGDVISWGLITKVKSIASSIKTTVESTQTTVDTLPEKVEQKLDPVQTDMAQLVESVQTQVDELREIVENSPAGVFPPDLFSLSAQSTEEGIKLTYQASLVLYTDGAQENLDSATPSDKKVALSRTKAVMFRYSDIETPTDITEGNLAFIDYDLFTKNGLGHNSTRKKTNTIVGLTQNKTYYISAFPISTNNVYNLNAGANGVNRAKCQWTGTKGTLTVKVTQDYDYKPLGEYTATMTPTAGGSAITKTQSGEATIVFSGLEAGEYTLSFSEVASFTKPSNQSVTVVAGQSQVLDLQYQLNVSLSSLSWAEIDEYAQMGVSNKLFSVGDTKDVSVSGETLTFEIVGFNHDDLADGSGKAKITFGMKNLKNDISKYVVSSNDDILNTTFYNGMPSDLRNVIKSVNKTIGARKNGTSQRTESLKIWLFSEIEIFGKATASSSGEGYKYEVFTANSSRVKKLSNGDGNASDWWLRSPYYNENIGYCYCNILGSEVGYGTNIYKCGICVGFCV